MGTKATAGARVEEPSDTDRGPRDAVDDEGEDDGHDGADDAADDLLGEREAGEHGEAASEPALVGDEVDDEGQRDVGEEDVLEDDDGAGHVGEGLRVAVVQRHHHGEDFSATPR